MAGTGRSMRCRRGARRCTWPIRCVPAHAGNSLTVSSHYAAYDCQAMAAPRSTLWSIPPRKRIRDRDWSRGSFSDLPVLITKDPAAPAVTAVARPPRCSAEWRRFAPISTSRRRRQGLARPARPGTLPRRLTIWEILAAMGECCDSRGYQDTFGDRFARRVARRYRRRGLNRTQQRLVDFLDLGGLEGATILEIGGGIGEIQVELLQRGGAHVTNLEISTGYEAEARDLLAVTGLTGRVTRRLHDIAIAPAEVEEADVVVLHRVVCCYRDYERLLAAAASHARRALVFSHPPRNLFNRAMFGVENLVRRLRRNDFRAFVHPPKAMIAVAQIQGLRPTYSHHGLSWDVLGFERSSSLAADKPSMPAGADNAPD